MTTIDGKTAGNARTFATRRYPTFGRGSYDDAKAPKAVTNSPFYWWYRFLQLNDAYAAQASPALASVYADLGDVHRSDFKSWWSSHVDLFAEPRTQYTLHVAGGIEDIAPFGSAEVVNLVVPLNWTNVGIKRRFGALIDKLVPKTPKGVRVQSSQAKYKLGRKWNLSGLAHAYAMLIEKRKADEERLVTGKKVSIADIAIRAGLPIAKGLKEGVKTSATTDQRRTVTIVALRHLKNAERFVAASASKVFPN